MRIAIIETGEPPKPLDASYPNYGAMMERMLAPVDPGFSFSRWRVFDGGAPPRLGEFDGLLITGSPAGVYEGHGWIAPLEDLVRKTADARKPQVGICFGHQLMAQAFGGKVEKSGKGWGVGLHEYVIDRPSDWMDPPTGRMACVVSHQDQVVEAPATARLLGGSEFCVNGVLEYVHAPALSFQPHPEFSHDYARDLMNLRRNKFGDALADEGISSLKRRSDRDLMAKWIANFFRANRA